MGLPSIINLFFGMPDFNLFTWVKLTSPAAESSTPGSHDVLFRVGRSITSKELALNL
tara:strand:- start:189 stop:359 length:171 start_codon:yes stop_codon:yes gene_type:complete